MDFYEISDKSIKTPTDILLFLTNSDVKPLTKDIKLRVFRALNIVDLEFREPSRGLLAAIEQKNVVGYEIAGVVFMRLVEVKNPEMSQAEIVGMAVDLIRCLTEKGSNWLSNSALIVATGIYNYLSYKKSEHLNDFTDGIIAGSLGETINCMAMSVFSSTMNCETLDSKPLIEALHCAIQRQGDVKEWVRTNIPPRLRIRAHDVTQYKEILETVRQSSRGKHLQDQLGL